MVTWSLEINVFLAFAESPHERVSPVSVNNSFVIHVVVLPSLIKVLLQKLCFLNTPELEMGLNNLLS